MASVRPLRAVMIGAVVTLILGGLAAPTAQAKKAKALKCGQFSPGIEEAADAEVVKVTTKATEQKPVVIDYEHGPSLYPAAQESLYFNVQVYGPASGLYILQEFDNQSDIDLYLYDAAGEEVASSGAFNPAPIPGVTDAGGNGGSGYESINGYATGTCEGFTIESAAYATFGTPATLKIWLGEVQAQE